MFEIFLDNNGGIFMRIIKSKETAESSNSEKCKIFDYPFEDENMDLCVSVITGRYPEGGYCKHLVCKELIYILEGSGKLCFENKTVEFSEGDAVWINPNEKYYWDTKYCKITITCSPAFNPEQYIYTD